MPTYSGFDVSLSAVNYKLVRDRSGALQIRWLSNPTEPGTPGRTGTIIVDNLHHGLGPNNVVLAGDIDVVSVSNGADVTRRGVVYFRGGEATDGANKVSGNTGSLETTRLFASSFQWEGDVFMVLPTKVLKVAGGAATYSIETPSGMGSNLIRGPGVLVRGNWLFGLESTAGVSVGHVIYVPDTDTWTVNTTGDHVKASIFFNAHSKVWALEVKSVNDKGQANWILKTAEATDDATQDISYIDLTLEISAPFPTAIHALGQWMLVFGAEGEILAVSEFPPNRSLVPPGNFGDDDTSWGVGSRWWGDSLLVPGSRGLYSINPSGSSMRGVDPQAVQPHPIPESRAVPSAIGPFGTDMFVGTREDSDGDVHVYKLSRYQDGTFYAPMWEWPASPLASAAVKAIEALSSGLVYVLWGNATDGRLYRCYGQPSGGGPSPFQSDGSFFHSSHADGGSHARKKLTQVRGHLRNADSGGDLSNGNRLDVYVRSSEQDEGTFNLAGQLTEEGEFSLDDINVTARKGRGFAVRVDFHKQADNNNEPMIVLPIYLDYIEIPTMGRTLEMDIELGGGLARHGITGLERMEVYEKLRALIGKTTTFINLESSDSFQVTVETVDAVDLTPATGRERPRTVARVAARVDSGPV